MNNCWRQHIGLFKTQNAYPAAKGSFLLNRSSYLPSSTVLFSSTSTKSSSFSSSVLYSSTAVATTFAGLVAVAGVASQSNDSQCQQFDHHHQPQPQQPQQPPLQQQHQQQHQQQYSANYYSSVAYCDARKNSAYVPVTGDIIQAGTPIKETSTGILFPRLCNSYVGDFFNIPLCCGWYDLRH
jgi:hypothetical protein